MQKIDVHHHIVPKRYLDKLGAIGMTESMMVPFPKWTPEKSLSFMRKVGIDTAVVSISAPGVTFEDSQWSADLARLCNEHIAELKEKHPGRFGGFASIPLPYIEESIEELRFALDELKLDGVCLLTNYDGKYLGDDAFESFFDELDKRTAVVFIHPTDPGKVYDPKLGISNALVEAPFETTRTVANLIYTGVADRYKRIRYILSHGGGTIPYIGWRLAMIEYAQKNRGTPVFRAMYDFLVKGGPETGLGFLRRMYYDTALVSGEYALQALKTFAGQSRIVIGTDFPFAKVSPVVLKNLKKYSIFSEKDFKAIDYENCLGLFPQFQHINRS